MSYNHKDTMQDDKYVVDHLNFHDLLRTVLKKNIKRDIITRKE